MRILIICLNLYGGGAERVIANLSNYLIKENSVSILALQNDKVGYELNKKIEYNHVDRKIYSQMGKLAKKFKKISLYRYVKIKNKIKKYKPDVIMSFLPLPSLYTMLIKATNKKIKKIPVILSERGDPNVVFKNKIIYKIMKKLYREADGFVFQTEDAKNFYNKIINCQSEIIGNPIYAKFIKADYSHNRNKNIVSVGRLEPQKNHKLLIDSFEMLNKIYPDYKLLIYGVGSLNNSLQEYINSKSLNKSIILKGRSNKLYDEIYDSCMFVLPSDFEGMPNALLEALALGLPCISTDCPVGGPRMIIDNNVNGILVEVNNKNQLFEGMKKIISDKAFSNQLSENAIKDIQRYHPDKINKEWEEFIIKVSNYKINKGENHEK